jgi:hypothetical protein
MVAAPNPLMPIKPKFTKADYRGMTPTVKKVAAHIRECGDAPDFRLFASKILDECFPRSRHTTARERAQCLLDHCNQNIRFVPDSPGSEVISNPRVVLCLPGSACIPLEDCESHASAYLSLCRAVGIDVWLLLQKLDRPNTDPNDPDGNYEYHLAGMIRLDDGSQVRVDPSLKGKSRVGDFQPALEEQIIDPLDPEVTGAAGGAKLVTIGSRPRIVPYRAAPSSLRHMPKPMLGTCTPCEAAARARAAEERKLEGEKLEEAEDNGTTPFLASRPCTPREAEAKWREQEERKLDLDREDEKDDDGVTPFLGACCASCAKTGGSCAKKKKRPMMRMMVGAR